MGYRAPRREYERDHLTVDDLDSDPFAQFRKWLDAAWQAGVDEAHAMTLATADTDGRPSARTVLLKDLDRRGFTFFTNLDSRKGRELAANPHAALVFRWQELERQVCVTGLAERVSNAEADAYFATRPRDSQLAAWASPQSSVIAGRAELERRLADATARSGDDVARPPRWGGFRVVPDMMEFWQGRPARLHDRIRYRLADDVGSTKWVRERLAP